MQPQSALWRASVCAAAEGAALCRAEQRARGEQSYNAAAEGTALYRAEQRARGGQSYNAAAEGAALCRAEQRTRGGQSYNAAAEGVSLYRAGLWAQRENPQCGGRDTALQGLAQEHKRRPGLLVQTRSSYLYRVTPVCACGSGGKARLRAKPPRPVRNLQAFTASGQSKSGIMPPQAGPGTNGAGLCGGIWNQK